MPADEPGDRPLRADAQRNRDRIVAVAAEAFTERGTGASLDDIAKRAGVGPGTLYRHFPTRDALVAATLDAATTALADRAIASGLGGDPGERPAGDPDARAALVAWFIDSAEHLRTYDGLPELMTAALDDPGSPLHAQCLRFADITRDLTERAKRAGVVRADVDPVDVGTLVGSVAWAAATRGDSAETTRRLLALIVDGLG